MYFLLTWLDTGLRSDEGTLKGHSSPPHFFRPMSMYGCRLSASNRQTQRSAFSAIAELELLL